MEYTPGPRKFAGLSQSGNNHYCITGSRLGGKYKIARCPFVNEFDQKEAEANARLIAAAPDMAHVLGQFAMLNENHHEFRSITGFILRAREILRSLD